MKTAYLFSVLLILSSYILTSCFKENFINGIQSEESGGDCPPDCIDGMLRVKLTEEMASELESAADMHGNVATRAISYNVPLSSLGIARMERTFPHAGEFEERTRKEGLHLWYDVWFDKDVPLSKASGLFLSMDGIQITELRPKISEFSDEYHQIDISTYAGKSEENIFNDPFLLEHQWHYYNDGSGLNSIAGADINVIPVWKEFTTGKDIVTVCIVDGGIDINHEDLSENIWKGTAEDGSEINGYNFVKDSYEIVPTQHGTHVAGTVAAVNNNGIGVCGVAGGDYGRRIKGVRIMSCQILEDGENIQGDGAKAIKWGADHGAVISQNSWGYSGNAGLKDTPQSDKDAIDYFIKYAGIDADGKQTGPVKGGIVIFAAGNSSRNKSYPASYESCLSVSAISSDYEAALYTNYGDWIDVIAPGGDASKQVFIYSTLPGNKYGTNQGTSMACPHVSGIAALLASHFGGPGFTGTDLRKMIESSVRDISEYTPYMYFGKGLVDAYGAFTAKVENRPPEAAKTICNIVFNSHLDSPVLIEDTGLFTDPDGDILSLQITSSDKAVADVGYNNGVFSVSPCGEGLADIRIDAEDGKGGCTSISFSVLVRNSDSPADMYPNPASEYINIRTAITGTYSVSINSVSGSKLYHNNTEISAFNPLRIELEAFAPGYYTVTITQSGNHIFRGGFAKI